MVRPKQQVAMRTGLVFAAVWALVLAAAFAIYPATDNMITGFLVHAWFGVDAAGALSIGGVLSVAVLQVAAFFGLGFSIGLYVSSLRGE